MKKFKIAMIGLGEIAQKAYLPILASHELVDPVLCSRDEQKLKSLAHQYRIDEYYTTLHELALARVDAVMIHSATESHFEIAKYFLSKGIATFVDKPLSYSLEETNVLLDLADSENVPLFVGFNRRYIALAERLQSENPFYVSIQKNRVNLPGEVRQFVLDDFIHVIDLLLFLGEDIQVEDFEVFSTYKKEQLSFLQISWRHEGVLYSGVMNRVCGLTEEVLELCAENVKWHVEDLSEATRYFDGETEKVVPSSWEPMLAKRGFTNMINEWIEVLSKKSFDKKSAESIRNTHQLCEKIILEVEKNKKG